MTQKLDLSDIQGNIIRAYGHSKFLVVRYFFLHVNQDNSDGARKFVDAVRQRVTTSVRWGKGENRVPKPKVTLNIGFSWYGLLAFGLPTRTLAALPSEFIDGMKLRAHILGDEGESDPKHWDEIWKESKVGSEKQVHIWISMNAQFGSDSELDKQTKRLEDEAKNYKGGVTLLPGHGPNGENYQEARALWGRAGKRVIGCGRYTAVAGGCVGVGGTACRVVGYSGRTWVGCAILLAAGGRARNG